MYKFTNESGIYVIKNVKNGKSYIGSAVNLRKRINLHKSELNRNIHHSIKLQNSWNKHGRQYFIYDLVELVPDIKNLIKTEQRWIDLYDSYHNGYNSRPIAESPLGTKHTKETREKMSAWQKGIAKSEETREKMSAASMGRVFSEETRAKMSASAKNKPPRTEEAIAKFVASMKRKRLSQLTKI